MGSMNSWNTVTPIDAVMHSDRMGIDIRISIVHLGLETGKDTEGFRYMHDRWSVTLRRGGALESFDYWTGIGHRKPGRGCKDWEKDRAMKIIGGANLVQDDENFSRAKEILDKGSVPAVPKPDDILYCLLVDAEALEYGFEDWCRNFGYDTDSRKAFETYEKCRESGRKLLRLGLYSRENAEKFADY